MFKGKKVLFAIHFVRRTKSFKNWIELITEDGSKYKYNLPNDSIYCNGNILILNPPNINIDDIKPEVVLDKEEILNAYNLSKNIHEFSFTTKRNGCDCGNEFLYVERNGSFEQIAKNGNSSGGVGGDAAKKIYEILTKINFFRPSFDII